MAHIYADTLTGTMVNLDDPTEVGPIRVTLTYRRDDPYAVTADIADGEHDTVTWTFARDLLRAGLHATAGLGDVIVSPDDGGLLHVELRSEDGRACMHLDTVEVAAFLDRADRIVLPGDEARHLGNVDRGIRQLMRQAER